MLKNIFWYFGLKSPAFTYPYKVIKQYEGIAAGATYLCVVLSLFSRPKKIKYVFIGAKYKSLIRGLPRSDVLVVGGVRQLVYSMFCRVSFKSNINLYADVIKAYKTNDDELLYKIRDKVAAELSKYSPEFLVVVSDSLPMERLWIESARKLGVKSLCMQHGLFSSAGSDINDGKFADIMFVFDELQKRIVEISTNRKVLVLGYHSDIKKHASKSFGPLRICILGQPYPQYYAEKSEVYFDYIADLISTLKENDYVFKYKPHPSEKNANYLSSGNLSGLVYNKSLNKALNDFDCFISLTSTALLEVTLAGKCAIQIYDDRFSDEWFEDYGYSYSISRNNLDALPYLINGCKNVQLHKSAGMVAGTVTFRFLDAISRL